LLRIQLLFLFVLGLQAAFGQPFDLVITHGHVIDPKNQIDAILDVGVSQGKIMKVASRIDSQSAKQIIDASGKFVVPGLIDIHTHLFRGSNAQRSYCNGPQSLLPDSFAPTSGVTTVVDAGSSGWRDFAEFKKKIIDSSKTRVFAFLNIVGAGMRGGRYEQDRQDMNPLATAKTVSQFRAQIVGIKLAHYQGPDWYPVEQAIQAAKAAGVPLMVDFGNSDAPLSMEKLFANYMRRGDIYTHCFAQVKGRESIVAPDSRELRSFVWTAKRQGGIIFDVGAGAISLAFSQARPAMQAGFYPNSISTDMHARTSQGSVDDILLLMSKFLALGMKVPQIIRSVTWNPAQEINHKELGNLSEGSVADITILALQPGQFTFSDCTHQKIQGSKSFSCVATIERGNIVYQKN
jgi:dihydroorotase